MAKLIHVVDIGSSKIGVCSATVRDGLVEVATAIRIPSTGVERGLIRDINQVSLEVREALNKAETMLGSRITSVVAGVSGSHISYVNTKAMVAVAREEITQDEVNKVIIAARAAHIDRNVEILHTRPQSYTIDGGARIRNPIGMEGSRLDVNVHLVTAQPAMVRHTTRALEGAGLEVLKVVASPLACAYGASSEAQREQGVIVMDIGHGVTSLCVYFKKALVLTGVIEKGAELVTADIASSLRVPSKVAESIKLAYGLADPSVLEEDENIEIALPGRNSKWVSRSELSQIIMARYVEIFQSALDFLASKGIKKESIQESAVLLLSGGGSMIEGVVELAEKEFHLPAVVEKPSGLASKGMFDLVETPEHNTLLGLARLTRQVVEVKLGHTHQFAFPPIFNESVAKAAQSTASGRWKDVLGWFKQNF